MPIPSADACAVADPWRRATFSKWLKKEGEANQVRRRDRPRSRTDKATMEVEATDEGTLGRILIPEGTADVAGQQRRIATILSDGEERILISARSRPRKSNKRRRPRRAAAAPDVRAERVAEIAIAGRRRAKPMIDAPKGAWPAPKGRRRAPIPKCPQAPRW